MKINYQKRYRLFRKYFARQRRDSRYVFAGILSVIVFILSSLQATSQGLFDSVERPIFEYFNNLPNALDGVMYAVTQFGGAGSIVLWMAVAWLLINRRAALTVAGAGMASWYIAKFFKVLIGRGRPEALLENLNLFADKSLGGFGFPSGHASFVAACTAALYFQVERKYRKYLILVAMLVGISRMYLGAHFPLDIVGGWALGILIGSLVCLIFGVSAGLLSVMQIKRALKLKGYKMRHVRIADVDARGSRPLFLEDYEGKHYFAKIFGVQEHAADWLFKVYRFFRFKNLQAEEPYVNSRRNIEMESFATLWAKQGGVRVPTIIDLIKVQSSWMLILEKLDMKSLADHRNLRQKTLVDAWEQVEKLHTANVAHRDLRAANLMVDKKGQAWLIDFGFAEVSPQKKRQYMDVAELLMSMSLIVGVQRTVDAAMEVVDPVKLTRVLPYLQREVFSGATAKSLKSQKHLLNELKEEIQDRLAIPEDIGQADIVRFNLRKIVNIGLIGVLIYVIVPQFTLFRGAMSSLAEINILWLIPLVFASFLTYVFSALGLVILSNVPIKLVPTTLVQLAASFISKIIPAGIGTASLNIRYLNKSGNDTADSAATLATHNIIGFMMFVVPLGFFLLFKGENIANLVKVEVRPIQIVTALVVAAVAGLAVYLHKKLRRKILSSISQFVSSIRDFTSSRFEVGLTAATALAVSLSYIICLYICFKAFGIALGVTAAAIVYATAIVAKSVVPTPGGLGPLEIAMVSALLSLGIGKPEAVSVVVLYRLVTFWLPIPFSLLAYKYIDRKKLI